jgi:hypothetical protein
MSSGRLDCIVIPGDPMQFGPEVPRRRANGPYQLGTFGPRPFERTRHDEVWRCLKPRLQLRLT